MPESVVGYCGMCHAVPHPAVLTKDAWPDKVAVMWKHLEEEKQVVPSEEHKAAAVDYYVAQAPEQFELLPPDVVVDGLFIKVSISKPIDFNPNDRLTWPKITHVNFVDLNRDERLDVLLSDAQYQLIGWLHRQGESGIETPLAGGPPIEGFRAPAHTEAFDYDGDGDWDFAAACSDWTRRGRSSGWSRSKRENSRSVPCPSATAALSSRSAISTGTANRISWPW